MQAGGKFKGVTPKCKACKADCEACDGAQQKCTKCIAKHYPDANGLCTDAPGTKGMYTLSLALARSRRGIPISDFPR